MGLTTEETLPDQYIVSFGCEKNSLKFIVVMDVQLCKYTKSYWNMHFEWLNFMVYKLFLNKTTNIKVMEQWNKQFLDDFKYLSVFYILLKFVI